MVLISLLPSHLGKLELLPTLPPSDLYLEHILLVLASSDHLPCLFHSTPTVQPQTKDRENRKEIHVS